MVYLDHLLHHKPTRLVKGNARDRMIGAVMDALKDWRFSEFEHEAAVRRAVRLHFINKHFGWDISDTEAGALISKAFDRMGLKRPTWAEGQWYYTAARSQCLNCAGEIDDDDQVKGFRYCSSVCASSHKATIAEREGKNNLFVLHRARHEIAHRDAAPRPCKECGKAFRDFRPDATFCSPRCATAAMTLPLRPCKHCGEQFKPRTSRTYFCSHPCSCASNAIVTDRQCVNCNRSFRQKDRHQVFCSKPCHYEYGHVSVYDIECRGCHEVFQAKIPTALFCTSSCNSKYNQLKNGHWKPKKLSAFVFDFIFDQIRNAA